MRPLTARQVDARLGDHGRYEGNWGWNRSVVRRVLEDLFASGLIASAGRNAQFERRFFPASRLTADVEEPDTHTAAVDLVRAASRGLAGGPCPRGGTSGPPRPGRSRGGP